MFWKSTVVDIFLLLPAGIFCFCIASLTFYFEFFYQSIFQLLGCLCCKRYDGQFSASRLVGHSMHTLVWTLVSFSWKYEVHGHGSTDSMTCFFFILGCIGSSYQGEFVEIGKVVSIYLVKLLPENVLLAINRSIQSGLTPTDSTRSIAADPWSRPIDGASIKMNCYA